MTSTTLLTLPIDKSFLKSSLRKMIIPLTYTPSSEVLLNAASESPSAIPSNVTHSSLRPSTPLSPLLRKHRPVSIVSPRSIWTALAFACITLLTVMSPSAGVDAAPAKNIPAPNNLAKAMSFSLSETSALPLQLQIEAQVAGKQQLAYLPTTGPSLDFYYLNYRPTYIASESKIDFWMLTPKDTPAPKTASLELYDEYGKIHLVTLVPEGTEIPQAIANKNEPFLWKSWAIPKTLKADFDFSEKFRVVLKTSDSKPAHAVVNNINKRFDSIFELLARAKNKHIPTGDNANALMSFTSPDDRAAVAQDRQFHIRGLKATPGGKSNPAKLRVNSVAPAASQVSGVSTAMAGVSSQGVSSNGSDIITITPLLNKYNGEKKASAVAPTNTNSQTFVTLAAMVVALLLAL